MKNTLRIIVAVFSVTFLVVFMNACGGGGGGGTTGGGGGETGVTTPSAPTGILATFSSPATVSWDPVSNATSYNIYYSTTPGVTKANGTKISNATSPQVIQDLLDDTTYYFVVTAVNSAGESAESLQVSARHTTFAQADLIGIWNVMIFSTGVGIVPQPGWMRLNITVDEAGNAIINSFADSNPPAGTKSIPFGSLNFTIDEDGIVTEGGTLGDPDSYNVMSSGKNKIIGTVLKQGVSRMFVFLKQDPNVTFTDADINGKSFAFHKLESKGVSMGTTGWSYGTGSIDNAGQMTISSIFDSASPSGGTPPAPITVTIDSNGVVSTTGGFFIGVMSSDKESIIGVYTNDAGGFVLKTLQITGHTFNMGEIAGASSVHTIIGGTASIWQHGVVTTNTSGLTNWVSYADSTPSTTLPPSFTVNVAPDGTITRPLEPALQYHGTASGTSPVTGMSISTYTAADGAFGFAITIR